MCSLRTIIHQQQRTLGELHPRVYQTECCRLVDVVCAPQRFKEADTLLWTWAGKHKTRGCLLLREILQIVISKLP